MERQNAGMSGLVLDATGSVTGSRTRQVPSYVRTALMALLVFAGYYVGTLVALKLRFPSLRISVIWPPSAVLLARPAAHAGPDVVAVVARGFGGQFVGATQRGTPVSTVAIYYVGNALEAVVAVLGVRRFSDSPHRFDTLWSVAMLIGFAGIIAPGVTSIPGRLPVHPQRLDGSLLVDLAGTIPGRRTLKPYVGPSTVANGHRGNRHGTGASSALRGIGSAPGRPVRWAVGAQAIFPTAL
jgi:hypothetical protein